MPTIFKTEVIMTYKKILTGDKKQDKLLLKTLLLKNDIRQVDLVKKFGVCPSHVSGVINRRWNSAQILNYICQLA